MNTKTSVFSFESHSNIRAVNIDGNPWFVSSDVCKAIGIKHTASAMRALDDDEKGVHLMHTPGGQQDFTIISESGLYTLILRCRDAVTPAPSPSLPQMGNQRGAAADPQDWPLRSGRTLPG